MKVAKASVVHRVETLRPEMPAEVVGALLLRQHLAVWRSLLPAVRAGDDPEVLRRLRVCGRRLIAVLRVLEAAQVPEARALRHQIAELLGDCGVARDLDVRVAALDALCSAQSTYVHPAFQRRLRLRRLAAQLNLLRSLDRVCSRDLFDSLEQLTAENTAFYGSRAIGVVGRALLRDLHRSAGHAARHVDQEPSLAHCHALRLEIKKLRYVAEGFGSVYGGPLKRYLGRLHRLQSLLGRINDARQLIPVFEVEAARARTEDATAALAIFDAAVDRQRRLLQDARGKLRAQRRQLGGERWRDLCHRMDEVAKRTPK